MKSHLNIFFKRKVYFFDNYKTALLYNILLYKDSMMLRYAISASCGYSKKSLLNLRYYHHGI